MRHIFENFLFCILTAACAAAQTPPDDRLAVGVIVPLTGGFASYGVATKNGIELALAAESSSASKLQIAYEDSQYNPKEALSAFQRLILNFKPDVVYNLGTGANQSVIPLAESGHVPLLAMTTEAAASSDKVFTLRFSNYAEEYSLALLGYLRKRGFKKIGIIQAEAAYFEEVVKGIKKNLRSDEAIVFLELVHPGDNDFRSLIVKLKGQSLDALGVLVGGGQNSQFFRQARDLGLVKPFFGSNALENQTDLQAAHGAMEGVVYPTMRVTDEFRKLYWDRYGNDFQVAFAALGYDLVMLCRQLIDRNPGPKNAADIIAALRSALPVNGATGQLRYREWPEAGPGFDFPVGLRIVRGQTTVPLEAQRGD